MARSWRAVAVDDEPPALTRLRDLLAPDGEVELVAGYTDPAEALEGIAALRPDLAFLDIQMPGMTGLELAAALGDAAPLVVFVTAYDQHALAAFEVHAFDYLLKPVEPARLRTTLARVKQRLGGGRADDARARLEAVMRSIEAASGDALRRGRVSFRLTAARRWSRRTTSTAWRWKTTTFACTSPAVRCGCGRPSRRSSGGSPRGCSCASTARTW
jgi:DNA-binding LytR/AlgR family response regulator